ncbi:unnamed protein product [Leuciscus chuanchicus]
MSHQQMQIEKQKELCSPSRRCDRRYDSRDQTRESRSSFTNSAFERGAENTHTKTGGGDDRERASDGGGIAEHETSSRGNVKHSHTDRCQNNSRRQCGYSGHVTLNLLSETNSPYEEPQNSLTSWMCSNTIIFSQRQAPPTYVAPPTITPSHATGPSHLQPHHECAARIAMVTGGRGQELQQVFCTFSRETEKHPFTVKHKHLNHDHAVTPVEAFTVTQPSMIRVA